MLRISVTSGVAAACLMASALALSGCGDEAAGLTLPPAPSGAADALSVKVEQLALQPLHTTVRATGTARAARVAVIGSALAARIEAIPVAEGQTVEAGALLVRLDDRQARLQVSQAHAAATAAQVQADQARAEVERLSPLAERGSIARSRVDQLDAQARAAEANAKAAGSATRAARRLVSDADIVAPFAGTVIELAAEVGEMSLRSPTLVRLADLSTLEVVARVHTRELSRLTVGDAAVARFPNLGRAVEGTVSRFGHEVDRATRTVEVFSRIPNPDAAIPFGAFVELTITPSGNREGLVVPRAAVADGDEGPAVFALDGDRVRRLPVSVRALDEARIELTGGVDPGQAIVVEGADRLVDGIRVAVARDAPTADGQRAAASPEPTDEATDEAL